MRRDAEQAAPGDHCEHLGQHQPRVSQREAPVFEDLVVALIMLGVVLPIVWAISK
jgi:hypothetical protein